MTKLKIMIILQTILNFIALERIFLQWIPNSWMPDRPIGALIVFPVWGAILALSYALAVRFNNQDQK